MPIIPDTKNWTWVLERPCPECGFDAAGRGGGRPGSPQRPTVARRAGPASWPGLMQSQHDPVHHLWDVSAQQ